MKLWQKTSLIFTAVLIVIVFICSTILLIHSKNSILELTFTVEGDDEEKAATDLQAFLTANL